MTSSDRIARRRYLAGLGTGVGTVIAGCLGGNDPQYEAGDVDDVTGDERDAEEMAAAEAIAERDPNPSVTQLSVLRIADHEFVLEENYMGSTVEGTLENAGDERIKLVEIRVRVYDDEGNMLGRYLDRAGDLNGETAWNFKVILLESPDDIAHYDVAALGIPA